MLHLFLILILLILRPVSNSATLSGVLLGQAARRQKSDTNVREVWFCLFDRVASAHFDEPRLCSAGIKRLSTANQSSRSHAAATTLCA
jgi:hypothetical protein